MTRTLPSNPEGWVIGKQILRSATSVAANYRAACRARSHSEFVAKIGIVLEEADETAFWLDMLADAGTVKRDSLASLIQEANELTAIFVACSRTARARTK